MNLKNAKLFGGVGSLLMVIALLPGITNILLIPGWFLILSALNDISEETKNRGIFYNYLISVGILLAGLVLLILFAFSAILGIIGALASMSVPDISSFFAAGGGISIILALLVFYLTFLVSSYYAYRSFQLTGLELKMPLFGMGGLFLFIGGLTVLLFGLGLIAIFIGLIIISVAFFQLPDYPQSDKHFPQ